MTLMQLIKKVLDRLYPEIKGPKDADRDARIVHQLQAITTYYNSLTSSSRAVIDLRLPETRYAYIYKYTTAHADYVKQAIEYCNNELRPLLSSKECEIACVGGGPGSDFLGVAKYLRRYGLEPEVTCHIYDREVTWGEAWMLVAKEMSLQFKVYQSFLPLDLTNIADCQSRAAFGRPDLFTFIYILSELYSSRAKADPCLDRILGRSKSGARFLVVDNNASTFNAYVDGIMRRNGLRIEKVGEGVITPSYEEEKTDLGIHYSKFSPHMQPRLRADLRVLLARKL